MSSEMSRRGFLGRTGAATVVLATGLGGVSSGCASQFECLADGHSSVLELAMNQIRQVSTIVFSGRRGRTFVRSLGGYNPAEENPDAGWIFMIDGQMPDEDNTNAATLVPQHGASILWQVADAA